MSYSPTNWKNGDIVTAEKLNNLENGVQEALAGGVLFVPCNLDLGMKYTLTATKTAGEIYTAAQNGALIVFSYTAEASIVYLLPIEVTFADDAGYVFNLNSEFIPQLSAPTAEDYPSTEIILPNFSNA